MKKFIWVIALGCAITLLSFVSSRTLSVSEVFDRISKIERFETMPYESGIMGFRKIWVKEQ